MPRSRPPLGTFLALLVLWLSPTLAAPADPRLAPAAAIAPRELALLPRLTYGALDRARLAAEDLTDEAAGLPMRFAVAHEVAIAPETDGLWQSLDDGTSLWRLRVTAAGATSLNFGFSRFHLPPTAALTILASDGTGRLGPFTMADNRPHGELWTPLLFAADAVLELHVADAERPAVELQLAAINQGYRGFGAGPLSPDKSGGCNVDVVCPEGAPYGDIIRSVAMFSRNGIRLCSGAMINNTAQNFRPLFLTANHCGITSANAASVVTYWNYQNSTCRPPGSAESGGPGNGSLGQALSGATFLASYAPSDFTLLELSSAPSSAWRVYWAGWDRSGANPSSAIGIHHPMVQEKRISFENNPLQTTSYLGSSGGDGTHFRIVDWDVGTTEGGSSGSPLFNPSRRIVGQLHGGLAACGNDESDWYGKLAVSWSGGGTSSSRLSDYLDPLGSGATTLAGNQPGTGGGSKPAAPSQLAATALSASSVALTWQDHANDETDFRVEAAPAGSGFVEVASLGANVTAATLEALLPSTLYQFRVRAHNAAGFSAYSNTAEATTPSAVPAAPRNLRVEQQTSGALTLRWEDASSNESSFEVEAREVARRHAEATPRFEYLGGSFATLATVAANATSYTTSALSAESLYDFRVRARKTNLLSDPSNEASALVGTAPAGSCTADDRSLCVLGGRFRLEALWHNFRNGASGDGMAIPQSEQTGFFWFFSPENTELVVKMLDGRPLNSYFWLFYGALSDVEYWVVATDLESGSRRTYYNAPTNICGVGDTEALAPLGFAAAPAAQAAGLTAAPQLTARTTAEGTCAPSSSRLCLLGNRMAVEVAWTNQHAGGATGVGGAIPSTASDQTGYFWFFNPANLELVVKVLDGRAINQHFWVFYGGLSDVEYELTVTDTVTGHQATYHNEPGSICGGADTNALAE